MPNRADKKRGRDAEEGEQSIESEKKRLAAIRAQSEKELEVRRLKYDEQLEQTVVDLAEGFTCTLRNMGASDEAYALMLTEVDRPGFTAVFIATVLRAFDIDEATHVIGRFFETMPGLPGSGECFERATYFLFDLASVLTRQVRTLAAEAVRTMIATGKVTIDTRLANGTTLLAYAVSAFPENDKARTRIALLGTDEDEAALDGMLGVIANAASAAAPATAAEAMINLLALSDPASAPGLASSAPGLAGSLMTSKGRLATLAAVIAKRIDAQGWSLVFGSVSSPTGAALLFDVILEAVEADERTEQSEGSGAPGEPVEAERTEQSEAERAIIAEIKKATVPFVRLLTRWLVDRWVSERPVYPSLSARIDRILESADNGEQATGCNSNSLITHGGLPVVAAESGNAAITKAIVRAYGPSVLFSRDRETGKHALGVLATRGSAGAIEALLAGHEIVRTDDTNETVLHIAVKLFVADPVSQNNRALLEEIATWHTGTHIEGALDSVDSTGRTPLALVAISGNTEAARLIDPLAQRVCDAQKTKLEQAAELASATGIQEALAIATSLTSIARNMSPWKEALLTAIHSIHSTSESLVQFLIEAGAARPYLACADNALLLALGSIPLPRAQSIAQLIGKAPFFEYCASLCAASAASAMSSIAVPVAELVARAFAPSDIGLVPNNAALVGDHFTLGMLFGCAVVASFNGLSGLNGLNGVSGLNGLNGLHGLFFSPAFLAEVFCSPHDQASMCPYAFQAREGLHRIIVPEVLFGMVSIVGTDPTEFQRLICKVEPVEATIGLW
jgi:hypothetical protein